MQNGRYRKMKWDNVIWGMLLIPVIDILMCLEINMILFMKYVISAKRDTTSKNQNKITNIILNLLLAKSLNDIPFPFPFSILEPYNNPDHFTWLTKLLN